MTQAAPKRIAPLVLLVEDEESLVLTLSDRLVAEGYRVEARGDGESALAVVASEPFDLAILDVMLPGMDGFAVCRELRHRGLEFPILMLTAKSQVVDKVVGLKLGADISAVIALTVNMGAYSTEIMRAGIQSIQRTQLEAADCLGLTKLQTILHVVLLPAMERVYPALSSQFVLLMLASSITSQISAEELTATANLVQSDTYRSFEVYMIVAVVYLALSALYRLALWAIGLVLFERRRRLGTPL